MLEGNEGNQRWLLCVVETKPLAQPFASLSLSFPFCKMERIISLPKILPEPNWTVNVTVPCVWPSAARRLHDSLQCSSTQLYWSQHLLANPTFSGCVTGRPPLCLSRSLLPPTNCIDKRELHGSPAGPGVSHPSGHENRSSRAGTLPGG